MEIKLDRIESGDKQFSQVMRDFYHPLDDAIKAMDSKIDSIKESLMKAVKAGKFD